MCLEVLQPLADIRPQLYLELKDKGFHNMLTFRSVYTLLTCTWYFGLWYMYYSQLQGRAHSNGQSKHCPRHGSASDLDSGADRYPPPSADGLWLPSQSTLQASHVRHTHHHLQQLQVRFIPIPYSTVHHFGPDFEIRLHSHWCILHFICIQLGSTLSYHILKFGCGWRGETVLSSMVQYFIWLIYFLLVQVTQMKTALAMTLKHSWLMSETSCSKD